MNDGSSSRGDADRRALVTPPAAERAARAEDRGAPAPRSVPRLAHAGFSLVEVLVAMVVLTMGALAVAGSVSTVIAANTVAGEQTRAVALAVQKMERLKAAPPDDVVDEDWVTLNQHGQEGSGNYRRKVDVVDDTEGADEKTKEVTVTVEYRGGEFGTRRIDLFTIIYTE